MLSLIIAVLAGWQMYSRNLAGELWGHRPLFLYLGLMGFVLLLLEKRFARREKGWKMLGWALLSGVLLSGGFTPSPLFPLMFVGFVPLLFVERRIAQQSGLAKKTVFKYAFWGFLLWNVLTTYWVTNTLFMAGLMAILPNTLLMTIPWILFHQTKHILGNRLGYASLPAYWMTFELVHLHWKDMSWPWLNLGNSFARFPEIIQWYEITGTFGGSLWIWVLNLLIFFLLWQILIEKKNIAKGKYILPAAILFLPIIVSLIRYATYQETGEQIEVVVVQPNYEPHYEKFTVPQREQIRNFLSISREGLTPDTDYIVFPETSFGSVWHNTRRDHSGIKPFEEHAAIVSMRALLSEYPKLNLVTGLGSYRIFTDPTQAKAPRQFSDGTTYESYNSAIQLSSGDPGVQIYLKSKLVPGAEFPPFASLTIFKPLIDELGGSMSGLGTQKERLAFFNKDQSVGIAPVICYESIFGKYTTGYVRKGANAIFIVTNDGWWDNTAGHIQHNHFASLRAIETRRSVARSANMGTCGFINQRGDRTQQTTYGEMGFQRGKITLNDKLTFYTRYGDMIGQIALYLAIILFLQMVARGLKK